MVAHVSLRSTSVVIDHTLGASVLQDGAALQRLRPLDGTAAPGAAHILFCNASICCSCLTSFPTGPDHRPDTRCPPSTASTLPVMKEPASDASSSSAPSNSRTSPR